MLKIKDFKIVKQGEEFYTNIIEKAESITKQDIFLDKES
jgi:hypothetical protein